MAASGDTEITLGTGKMLVLFFGLVALCAVFFGMGFSLGKSTVKTAVVADVNSGTAVENGPRPSASKNLNPASPEPVVKPVGQKNVDTQADANSAANGTETGATPATSNPPPADPLAAPPLNGYYVQVAAVSKQEDAEALVDALKKKQYAAFSTNASADKLYRVQVGPFGDIKEAEATRAKLVGDGYNPILKK